MHALCRLVGICATVGVRGHLNRDTATNEVKQSLYYISMLQPGLRRRPIARFRFMVLTDRLENRMELSRELGAHNAILNYRIESDGV